MPMVDPDNCLLQIISLWPVFQGLLALLLLFCLSICWWRRKTSHEKTKPSIFDTPIYWCVPLGENQDSNWITWTENKVRTKIKVSVLVNSLLICVIFFWFLPLGLVSPFWGLLGGSRWRYCFSLCVLRIWLFKYHRIPTLTCLTNSFHYCLLHHPRKHCIERLVALILESQVKEIIFATTLSYNVYSFLVSISIGGIILVFCHHN